VDTVHRVAAIRRRVVEVDTADLRAADLLRVAAATADLRRVVVDTADLRAADLLRAVAMVDLRRADLLRVASVSRRALDRRAASLLRADR